MKEIIRFAHLADCHLGSYRDERLRELSRKSFEFVIDHIIQEKADFVLIAGDLFNTAVPAIDILNFTVKQLQRLKQKDIPVYIICGSHDFSPSGKTMIDVLDSAGLLHNVVKGEVKDNRLHLSFTEDQKTGAKITGMIGRRGMLEKSYYESLDTSSLEQETGFKIFMLHTALSEFKPKDMADMDSSPLSLLPKHFNYYAAGHVHYVFEKDESEEGYGLIVYPGPTFPNSFKEIEELKHGTFRIVEYHTKTGKISSHQISVEMKEVISYVINCKNKTASQVEMDVENITKDDIRDKIITLRFEGTLIGGTPADISFSHLQDRLLHAGAFLILKNTSLLQSKEMQHVKITIESADTAEDLLIDEHLGKIQLGPMTKVEMKALTRSLMAVLLQEKKEGEKRYDFEERIRKETDSLLRPK